MISERDTVHTCHWGLCKKVWGKFSVWGPRTHCWLWPGKKSYGLIWHLRLHLSTLHQLLLSIAACFVYKFLFLYCQENGRCYYTILTIVKLHLVLWTAIGDPKSFTTRASAALCALRIMVLLVQYTSSAALALGAVINVALLFGLDRLISYIGTPFSCAAV